ncbi:hypothetical protein BGZ63DRAFT_500398 [Mariannaea sp. PMI_226]|nr:hypothetical protein BGZ63DRAFT_500398 [Mariannaea sp. PMI_226]
MSSESMRTRGMSTAADQAKGRGGRVSKRSGNACTRCRKQKIKCSGSQPCEACKKRKLSCEFDERDQKILVTRGYLLDLQKQIASLRQREGADYITPGSLDTSHDAPRIEADPDSSSFADEDTQPLPSIADPEMADQTAISRAKLDSWASGLTNPLSTGPSKFMTSAEGRTYYLGTSSNWSFSRRVLSLAHEHVYNSPVSTSNLLFDGSAYDLGWDGSRNLPNLETPSLPNLDHAIYLINTVKFHCSQVFHLFDEDSFMKYLYEFYTEPTLQMNTGGLKYIHLLIILAFGKALVGNNCQGKRPPGSEYFVKALQLLPSIHVLFAKPILATEILCCIALYFQCLDFRHSAHNFIGQAISMALGQGMHTDMPQHDLGEELVERSRKAWWTAYVLDREMTSLMGLPQSIHDDDVHPTLPSFAGSAHRVSALHMQIRFAQTIAAINRGVYGVDGRLNKKFLLSTKEVLASVAGLADELHQKFPMQTEKTINGLSRTAGYLHLLYHQCIVLATRPLLFCFLKIRFESPETFSDALNSSQTVWNLIKMCIDSSLQMINILGLLQSHGLLEKFLPFDLESLFISSLNLILALVLDSRFLDSECPWRQTSYLIFNEMVASGNLIAEFRLAELQQLDDMLRRLPPSSRSIQSNIDPDLVNPSSSQGIQGSTEAPPSTEVAQDDNLRAIPCMDDYTDIWLTTAQIIDMANSIANSDTEWVSHTMSEHDIW